MAPRKPKTKYDALVDIGNELIDSMRNSKGLITYDENQLAKLGQKAEENKDGDPAKYWAIRSFIEILKGDYNTAYTNYNKAWNLGKNNYELMVNYPALLFRLNYFKELFSESLRYLKFDSAIYQPVVHIINASYILLNTEALKSTLELFKPKGENFDLIDHAKKAINNIPLIEESISLISFKKQDYVDSMKFLNKFISKVSLEGSHFRVSVEMNTDHLVRVEVFLHITPEQAIELNQQFDQAYINYCVKDGSIDKLEKFIVYFKPFQDVNDGRENSESIFIVDEVI